MIATPIALSTSRPSRIPMVCPLVSRPGGSCHGRNRSHLAGAVRNTRDRMQKYFRMCGMVLSSPASRPASGLSGAVPGCGSSSVDGGALLRE